MTDKPIRSRRQSSESPGAALRRSILELYTLDPAERLILDQAAHLADVLDRLNREVAGMQTFLAEGSRGQPTVSAFLAAQRQHAETLARLLESLALPAPDEEEGELSSTRKARKAALVRWTKEAH
jgi:hypothetical protein